MRNDGRRAGVLATLWIAAGAACGNGSPGTATLSVTETLASGDTAGYARVTTPRAFSFPADHGPHPEYRHEWWYFTGNLESASGDFGFQLTFFRNALRPEPPTVDSEWAASQAYMAHFALTDVAAGRFRASERFDRGALELAGARTAPLRVWVDSWSVEEVGPSAVPGTPAFRARAAGAGAAIDLRLEPLDPPVPQGVEGLSAKGPEPGNASYYYSIPRLRAVGTVSVDGVTQRVTGSAWLDREWGTSALGPGLAGWDWFSIQLETGSELMFYRLRREDGSTDRFSAGSLILADGRVERLTRDDVVLDVLDRWSSPRGVRYPSGWRLRVPRLDLSLEVRPRVLDQELDLSFRYWEGSVEVEGTHRARAVRGLGYVELTGYDTAPGS